jgi:hypothetical protein
MINEQPQQLKSPDGSLQTLHHRMAANRFGHRNVDGAVRNVGGEASLDAAVTADFYDAAGNYIGSETDVVRRLGPGRTGAFEIVYSGPGRADVEAYRLAVARQE